MRKKRIDSNRIEFLSLPKNLKGEVVGIVDDLLETGGTLLKAFQQCKKNGAKKIVALVTHGVLPSGITRIKKRYSKLYLTNTIKQKGSNIDITDLILETISES